MDVKEAIAKAKIYVSELFVGEKLSNLGLEEVEFDDRAQRWEITLGFSRPWDSVSGMAAMMQHAPVISRTYKIVRVADQDGKLISISNRKI